MTAIHSSQVESNEKARRGAAAVENVDVATVMAAGARAYGPPHEERGAPGPLHDQERT